MKINYAFITGETVEIEVDVADEWAEIIMEIEHDQQLKDRAETRRHQSLNELSDLGVVFSDPQSDIVRLIEEKETNQEHQAELEQLSQVISALLPQQKALIRKLFFDGCSMAEVAREDGVTSKAVQDRVKKIKSFIQKKKFIKNQL